MRRSWRHYWHGYIRMKVDDLGSTILRHLHLRCHMSQYQRVCWVSQSHDTGSWFSMIQRCRLVNKNDWQCSRWLSVSLNILLWNNGWFQFKPTFLQCGTKRGIMSQLFDSSRASLGKSEAPPFLGENSELPLDGLSFACEKGRQESPGSIRWVARRVAWKVVTEKTNPKSGWMELGSSRKSFGNAYRRYCRF